MMSKTFNHKAFFYTISAISLIMGFLLLRDYLGLVAMAFIIAMIYTPLYERLLKIFKSTSIASALTITSVYLTIIIPLIFLASVIAAQVISVVDEIDDLRRGYDDVSLDALVLDVNDTLAKFEFINYRLESTDVVDFAKKAVSPLGSLAIDNIFSVGNTALGVISIVVIFTIVLSGALVNRRKIGQIFREASPLDDEIDSLYMKRLADMSKAMVKGVFVLALVNALATGFFLWIAGVDYVVFWILIAMFASLIPLGAGIVSVPIGIVLILTGNIWQGLLQLVSYLLIVSNLDQIFRPRLVPKDSGLHPALTVLSIFGGIKMFGFLGIIFGPLVMIFLVTTFEVYIKYYRKQLDN